MEIHANFYHSNNDWFQNVRQCAHFQHILSNILLFLNILKPIIVWVIEKCMDFHYVAYIYQMSQDIF